MLFIPNTSKIIVVESSPDPDANHLPYRVISPQETIAWISIGSYAGAAQWHAAKKILSQHGILAQMKSTDDSGGGFDLMVLQTEAEWARDLLSRGSAIQNSSERPTYGFPVYNVSEPNPQQPIAMRAEPISKPDLTDHQKTTYTIWIVALWVLFAVVVLITILFTVLSREF